MYLPTLGAVSTLLASLVTAQSTFTPARPPALPLAVKNPYLSTWFAAGSQRGNGGYLPGQWPSFWTGQILGWAGLIRVDGETFTWMGSPSNFEAASQVAYEYTSTKSIFTIDVADKVTVKATFLSPVTPNDFKRQSLISSYLSVSVFSKDGQKHDVQLYTDISAEWVSGDSESVAQWDSGEVDGIAYHKVWKQNQQLFHEINDRAEWGNWYYATDAAGHTRQSGRDETVRGIFRDSGELQGSKDTNYRPINNDYPVFGFAVDLGSIGSSPVSTLFTITLAQETAIQFLGADGLKNVPSLWTDYFDDELAALSFFYKDYPESDKLSTELDNKVATDSKAAAGDNYLILTSLAVRQAFGATQLVGTQDKHYLFLKEISSNGNMQTVDVFYPASPIFFYMNPELVKLLLDPHFENQESGHYPNKWAIHDLGTHYPNATGHADGNDEHMPVEECGNNIIMALAYAQRTNNNAYLTQHYDILTQWAGYLVDDALLPAEQLSTDDFAGHLANQTNLALKGIIGLAATAEIAARANNPQDADKYSAIARSYIDQWQSLGINYDDYPPHSILTYNDQATHGLLYNLYNDRLVNTSLVPQFVYDMQSTFYPTIKERYGVALDTRNQYWTKGDWEVFCAAVASDETRDLLIAAYARWVAETPTGSPFTDLYNVNVGTHVEGIEFKARPVQGGMFALLALQS
ncbi:unnamed protein product [Periconia digitata]|uniref:Glutaminase GtaA n=1 Tax=Periconia digitata TaxID=1303443 RepID=A0A9W4XRS9_9PLEO|nr:unnamed protein product [Periconia digitata]